MLSLHRIIDPFHHCNGFTYYIQVEVKEEIIFENIKDTNKDNVTKEKEDGYIIIVNEEYYNFQTNDGKHHQLLMKDYKHNNNNGNHTKKIESR